MTKVNVEICVLLSKTFIVHQFITNLKGMYTHKIKSILARDGITAKTDQIFGIICTKIKPSLTKLTALTVNAFF